MALSPTQLAQLRQDLTILAVIHYDSIMDELLDHYATLTEQKMDTGLSFENASRWAWAGLGSGAGIQQIQTDFEESIGKRHIAIMRSYFRWPTIVVTVLIATLVYLITPLVPANTMDILLSVFWIVPMLVFVYGYKTKKNSHSDRREILQIYLTKSSGAILYSSWFSGFLLREFTHKPTEIWLFQIHSTVGVILCCLSLIYAVSLLQLLNENFRLEFPKLSIN